MAVIYPNIKSHIILTIFLIAVRIKPLYVHDIYKYLWLVAIKYKESNLNLLLNHLTAHS